MQIITDVLKRTNRTALKIRAYRKLHASGEIEIRIFPIKISPSKIYRLCFKTRLDMTIERRRKGAIAKPSEECITALSERSLASSLWQERYLKIIDILNF